MDTYIFFGFMLVLVIFTLVDGQRQHNAIQRGSNTAQRYTWKVYLLFLPLTALVLLLAATVVDPWINERISGANTEWVVSYIVLFAMLGTAWFVFKKIAGRFGLFES